GDSIVIIRVNMANLSDLSRRLRMLENDLSDISNQITRISKMTAQSVKYQSTDYQIRRACDKVLNSVDGVNRISRNICNRLQGQSYVLSNAVSSYRQNDTLTKVNRGSFNYAGNNLLRYFNYRGGASSYLTVINPYMHNRFFSPLGVINNGKSSIKSTVTPTQSGSTVEKDYIRGEKTGSTTFAGIGISGTAAGSVLHGETNVDKKATLTFKDENGDWNFKNFGIGATASATGAVCTGELKGNIGYLHGGLSGSALTGTASGEVRAELFEDGKFQPSLYAGGKLKVSALHGETDVGFGNDQYGVYAKASGDVGTAEASGGVGIGYVGTDEKNNPVYGVKAEGKAMASAAEGKVSGGITVFGIDVDVGLKGYAGAVGVEGGAHITTEGVKGSFGAAMLFGGKVEVDVDWSDAQWIDDTVDAVGGAIDNARDFITDSAYNIGNYAVNSVKVTGETINEVTDFISSQTRWFH
ncbi:MAG: hypothetical protein IJN39_03010, partial [Clostridia bacterium]|nr:hypothetical protein [Clostridia bacterium]